MTALKHPCICWKSNNTIKSLEKTIKCQMRILVIQKKTKFPETETCFSFGHNTIPDRIQSDCSLFAKTADAPTQNHKLSKSPRNIQKNSSLIGKLCFLSHGIDFL